MALNWNWNEKIGELLIRQGEDEFTISIYKGNALAIFLHEYVNDKGEEVYSMYGFFCDKEHFNNCTKDKTWNYAEEWVKITLGEVTNDLWIVLKDLNKRGVNIEIRGAK